MPLGNMLRIRCLVYTICRVRVRAGIPDCRSTTYRTDSRLNSSIRVIKLYKVRRLLGHKTGTMTQRHAYHRPESLQDGFNVLEYRPAIDTNLSHWGGTMKAGSSKSFI